MTRAITFHGQWERLAVPTAVAVLLSSFVMAATADTGPAAPAPIAKIQTEVLVEPTPSKIHLPNHPEAEVRKSGERWVQLAMLVDPGGKPLCPIERGNWTAARRSFASRSAKATSRT
jgi:hypothetical protein